MQSWRVLGSLDELTMAASSFSSIAEQGNIPNMPEGLSNPVHKSRHRGWSTSMFEGRVLDFVRRFPGAVVMDDLGTTLWPWSSSTLVCMYSPPSHTYSRSSLIINAFLLNKD